MYVCKGLSGIRRFKLIDDVAHILANQPGQRFCLSTRDLKLRLPSRKLSPRYVGPFKILRQINAVTYELELPVNYRISPSFHVSLLKPFHPDADPNARNREPPPPLDIDGTPAYAVKELLTPDGEGVSSNTWWTGRDTDQRRDHG